MTRKPIFARLATEARLKGNQSPLYQWFLQHHDQFAAVLAKISRPGWQSIANELSAEGLAMKDGTPITASYARLTWWRAHKSFEAKRSSRPVPKSIPEARGREIAAGVLPVVDDEPAMDAEPGKFRFGGHATLRGHTPAPPPAEPPEPAPRPPVQDVDEVVARLMGKPRNKPQPK